MVKKCNLAVRAEVLTDRKEAQGVIWGKSVDKVAAGKKQMTAYAE